MCLCLVMVVEAKCTKDDVLFYIATQVCCREAHRDAAELEQRIAVQRRPRSE